MSSLPRLSRRVRRQVVGPRAGLEVELAVLVGASAIATIVRFLVLRSWMDRRHDVPERPRVVPEGVAR